MPEICAADSVYLSLLVFTQLFSEVARYQPAKLARKQFNAKTKYPVKVIQGHIFWGHWKGGSGLNNTV